MFPDENEIIEQSDLFPTFIDDRYLRACGIYLEGLSYLKNLLGYDFRLNDYTLAYDYSILKIDKRHMENLPGHVLTHEVEDPDDLEAWIAFKFYRNEDGIDYETWEEKMDLDI